jgi:hypothetical protein
MGLDAGYHPIRQPPHNIAPRKRHFLRMVWRSKFLPPLKVQGTKDIRNSRMKIKIIPDLSQFLNQKNRKLLGVHGY